MSENSLIAHDDNNKSANVIGEYNGTVIRRHHADAQMVNATQMCKAVPRRYWANFWDNDSTQRFVAELSLKVGIPINRLVYSTRGRYGGTWVHEDIALKLAGWLHPQFEVWYIQKAKQLIQTGSVSLHPEHQEAQITTIAPALNAVVQELREARSDFRQQQAENQRRFDICQQTLKELQSRPVHRLESVVEAELVRREGGKRQVELSPGHRLDVLKPGVEAIEVKHWKDYKAAFGQIMLYDRFLSNHRKRIHLFSKPFDKGPTERKRKQIETECADSGVFVTWHDWELTQQPVVTRFLPLQWDEP